MSKLIAAQAAIKHVEKDSKNDFQKYKYASSEAIIDEARKALNGAGLALITTGWRYVNAPLEELEYARALSDGGKPFTAHAGRVFVSYSLIGDDAPMVFECETPVIPERGRPLDKSMAAALTYNLSYFLRGLLLIPRGDDDAEVDKRQDSGQQRRAQPQPPAQRQAQQPASSMVTIPTIEELKARKAVEKCAIMCQEWASALAELADTCPYWRAADNTPNGIHATRTAAKFGYGAITSANVLQVVTDLRVYGTFKLEEQDRAQAQA
jgi:hypothetical protein